MTSPPPSPAAARARIVAAAVLWSTGGAVIKLSGLEAGTIAAGRSLVCAAVLLAFLPGSRGRWTGPVALAATFYAATNALFVYANTRTTAGAAIFLQNLAPAWLLLLSPLLLRERPTRLEAWSVPVSLLGSSLFFTEAEGTHLDGNLAALAASLTYALLIVAYRRLTVAEGLTATVAGGACVVLLGAPSALSSGLPEPAGLVALVYLGALQQAGAAWLFISGIRGTSALEASLLTLLEPLLSPIWALLLVGETMSGRGIAGGAIVLGAAVVRTLASLRPGLRVEPPPAGEP